VIATDDATDDTTDDTTDDCFTNDNANGAGSSDAIAMKFPPRLSQLKLLQPTAT
jgi:hypothetical protein